MLPAATKSFLNSLKNYIGLLLFIICGILIYRTLIHQPNLENYGKELVVQFSQISLLAWFYLILLMLLNLSIESIKWKLVVDIDTPINWSQAFKSVFVGQAFAFYTPNRLGDYIGRSIMLQSIDTKLLLAKTAWVSYAQMLITIIIGAIAFKLQPRFEAHLAWIIPIIAIVSTFFYFIKIQFPNKWNYFNKYQIQNIVKIKLLSLSLLRYAVFIIEYAWVANILGLSIPLYDLIIGLAIMFISLSILPTFSYTEWVVRGQMILFVFSIWTQNSLLLIALSTLIWLVNLVLPAIFGAFLLLGFKLKR